MSMQVSQQSVDIKHGETKAIAATFPSRVRSAAAVLQGYSLSFGNNDHHLRDLQVEVRNINVNDKTVTADVQVRFIDGSNNKGSGNVVVAIIADIEGA